MTRLRSLVVSLLALGGLAVAEVPPGHRDFQPSPQRPVGWRGSDCTGVFPGATPPTAWDASGKGVLWRATMPHQTFASPIVVGNKVITLADPHTILAFDATTGKRLWYNARDTFDVVCANAGEARRMRRLWDLYVRHFSKVHSKMPKDSPAWLGNRKWSSDLMTVVGLDLDAERAEAEKELAAAGIDPAKNVFMNHSVSNPFFDPFALVSFNDLALAATMSTPVSDGASVWVLWSSTRTVACYDVNTGACRWMRMMGPHDARRVGFNYASPLLIDGILVVRHGDMLSGLDPASGKDIWQIPLSGKKCLYMADNYSAETPLPVTIDGVRAVILWNGAAVEAKTGRTIFGGATWPKESCHKAGPCNFGSSPFLGAPGVLVQMPGKYGSMAARSFTAQGMGPMLWGAVICPVDGYVDEDTGQSVAHDGYVYLNDTGASTVIEVATGKVIPRGISGPSGGYPGVAIAGPYVFNFDGAASCTISTLGPEGRLVAINHLLPGHSHTQRISRAQGHTMKNPKGMDAAWWRQCFDAAREGVIGWAGRTHTLAAGEMSAGPFFQGERIYLRTHTELICLGR